MLTQFYQLPNCQYPFAFEVHQLIGQNYASMPIEVAYDSASRSFFYSKCNELSPAGDAQCSGVTPHEKEFTIVVNAFLPTAPTSTYNNNV